MIMFSTYWVNANILLKLMSLVSFYSFFLTWLLENLKLDI